METIYLSMRAKVAVSIFFMKSLVSSLGCIMWDYKLALLDIYYSHSEHKKVSLFLVVRPQRLTFLPIFPLIRKLLLGGSGGFYPPPPLSGPTTKNKNTYSLCVITHSAFFCRRLSNFRLLRIAFTVKGLWSEKPFISKKRGVMRSYIFQKVIKCRM